MTPDSAPLPSGSPSLEGRVLDVLTPQDLLGHVELAFDYRGDVTLVLKDGSQVAGYVFNRNAATRVLQIFVQGETVPRIVPYANLQRIIFSGADTASGKSWESWKSKSAAQRETEAREARKSSEALGHL